MTLGRGLKWLRSAKRRKDAFLWMHCFDAHMAYEAPPIYLKQHVSATAKTDKSVREQMKERGWFSPDFPEYDWEVPLEHFPQRYRAAVAYQDQCLGDFFSALKRDKRWDDALIVVTADHGECLMGDHGVYCAHKKLFDTTVRVPLRVKFPKGQFAGKRVDALVQHVDIAPTVAAMAGFSEPLYMGHDLAPVAAGEVPGHEVAFAEHVDNFMRSVRDANHVYAEQVPGSANKWGLAMEEGNLFTRASVPARDEAVERRLKGALDAILASGAEAQAAWGGASSADDEVAERLKSLGYM